MTDTPRTDAAYKSASYSVGQEFLAFARELERELATASSAISDRRWIPVAEKAPKRGAVVLAYWGKERPGEIDNRNFGVAEYRHPGGWCEPEEDDNSYAEPTHWMPLPEAPK